VRQSPGEPDPFRLKYREALRALTGEAVRQTLGRKDAIAHIAAITRDNVQDVDREAFREMAESELLGLHEGNCARYQIRPVEFRAWREAWNRAIA